MKLRIKKRQGALDFKPDSISLHMTNAIDIFAFLVGRYLLYGEQPCQTFANLKMPNKPAILEFWIVSGFIIGTPHHWSLSPSTIQKVMVNFGRRAGLPTLGQQQKPVGLYVLVSEYRARLKATKSQGTEGNVAARLRMLCRRFPSELIKTKLKEFFEKRTWPDYSLDQFEKFLKATAR